MPSHEDVSRALHRKLLPMLADSTRPASPLGGSYLLITLDMDQLEAPYSEEHNVIKGSPVEVEGRLVYIRCWHKPDAGGMPLLGQVVQRGRAGTVLLPVYPGSKKQGSAPTPGLEAHGLAISEGGAGTFMHTVTVACSGQGTLPLTIPAACEKASACADAYGQQQGSCAAMCAMHGP